jgi:predicted DNA-binding transcriptional regulator AlpA
MPRRTPSHTGSQQQQPAAIRALTEQEVSAIVGKTVRTLQDDRLHRRGVPFRKIGRSVRYLEHEVIAWLNAQPRGGEAVA